jgi:hypothetical protein
MPFEHIKNITKIVFGCIGNSQQGGGRHGIQRQLCSKMKENHFLSSRNCKGVIFSLSKTRASNVALEVVD